MINLNPLLTPAMHTYLIALIYRNTRTSCLSLAALGSSLSHDRLNRCLHSSFPWSRRLWELFASRMILEGGYLVLDDTTWERRARARVSSLRPQWPLADVIAWLAATYPRGLASEGLIAIDESLLNDIA